MLTNEQKQRLAQLRREHEELVGKADGITRSIQNGHLEDEQSKKIDEYLTKAEQIRNSDEFKKLVQLEGLARRISNARLADPSENPATDDNAGGDLGDPDERRGRSYDGRMTRSAQPNRDPSRPTGRFVLPDARQPEGAQENEAVEQMLRFGFHEMDEELRSVLVDRRRRHSQTRAADTYTLADGAVLITPQMSEQINVARAMFTSLKNLGCRVIRSTSGAAYTIPTVDYSGKVARFVGEAQSDTTQDTLAWGANEIQTYKAITSYYPISNELLQDTSYPVMAEITQAMAQMFDVLTAQFTVYGNGANSPLGLVTELCSAGHVVDTINSTSFVDDDLANLMGSVGDAYKLSPTSKFAFSPEMVTNRLLKLKSTTGEPLYQNSADPIKRVIHGQSWDMLTGLSDTVSLPPTPAAAACSLGTVGTGASITAGRIIALYGDFSTYVYREVMDTIIKRFTELKEAADSDCVFFRGYRRMGGKYNSASTSATTRPIAALRVKT